LGRANRAGGPLGASPICAESGQAEKG